MKGDIRQTAPSEGQSVAIKRRFEVIGLVVKNQRDKIEARTTLLHSRFIAEYAQLAQMLP